jgi:hypothetical protein
MKRNLFIELFQQMKLSRGSNPKKVGFLDWIWMGNPKPKKNPKIQKIQNPNPKKIQKSKKSKIQTQKNPKNQKIQNPNPKNIQIQFFFLLFKIDIQLI